jgi:hypothetical protein
MVRLEESGPGATWTTPVDHLLASGDAGSSEGAPCARVTDVASRRSRTDRD